MKTINPETETTIINKWKDLTDTPLESPEGEEITLTQGEKVEECYRFALANIAGMTFTEVQPVVDFVLEKNGLVVSEKVRKENLVIDLTALSSGGDLDRLTDYTRMIDEAKRLSEEYNLLAEKQQAFVLLELKRAMKKAELSIPVKPQLQEWKLVILNAILDNHEVTKKEVKEILLASDTMNPTSINPCMVHYDLTKEAVLRATEQEHDRLTSNLMNEPVKPAK